MIVNTSNTISGSDLVKALYPEQSGSGWLVARYDLEKKVLRTKIPCDQADWFLNQVRSSRMLMISSSTYLGKNIFPNFRSTHVVSITLDLKQYKEARTSDELFIRLCTHADLVRVPAPSAVAVTPNHATVLWVVDKPFYFLDLGDLFSAEQALAALFEPFGSAKVTRSASQFIPLPRLSAADGGMPVCIVCKGSIKIVNQERLIRSTMKMVTMESLESIRRNCEIIEELGALLLERSLDISTVPQLNWIWLAGFAAAVTNFVEVLEFKEIIRSVTESLETDWADSKDRIVPNLSFRYEAYLDILVRNYRDGYVKLSDDRYLSVNDRNWASELADLLNVSSNEVTELGLTHLVPPGSNNFKNTLAPPRQRMRLGKEDYVSLHQFLLAA